MSSASTKKMPDSTRYIALIVEALRSIGGAAKAADVRQWIADYLIADGQDIPEAVLPSGPQKFANDIQWARMYLVNAGLLEPMRTAGYGTWKLTRQGWEASLSPTSVKAIFKLTANKGKVQTNDAQEAPDEPAQGELKGTKTWEFLLKQILTGMHHKGFERLCTFLMQKNGLSGPKVTGQTGDGGIDGEGMLPIDDFGLIRAPVAWQCKRFKDGSVGSQAVRDFRGAIEGRAKYGLIFATSAFTPSAEAEARRPGATPIELVDLERLIELMRNKEIGVEKISDDAGGYQVTTAFFDEYLYPIGSSPGENDLFSPV